MAIVPELGGKKRKKIIKKKKKEKKKGEGLPARADKIGTDKAQQMSIITDCPTPGQSAQSELLYTMNLRSLRCISVDSPITKLFDSCHNSTTQKDYRKSNAILGY